MTVKRQAGALNIPVAMAPQTVFAALAFLYALAIVYSSLILGPNGFNFVAIGPVEALRKFAAVTFAHNGSDQRADWIANLMMTVPLAYLARGVVGFGKRPLSRWQADLATFGVCLLFILGVKYAQLFFPPRTVTLNYILAQSIGAATGIWLFAVMRRQIYPALLNMYRGGEGLVLVLGAYTILVSAYFLMPFDLALSPDDLATRLSQVPLAVFPGAGHDPIYRALLLAADAAATVPVGMFLAITGRDLPFRSLLLRGVGLIVPVTILTLFVLSATPFALSLMTRIAGVGAGICFMWALKGKDLWKRHYLYARNLPILVPIYVVCLALINGLLTFDWQNIDRGFAALEPGELFPLWSLYIVTKAQAAQDVVTTALLFAPIGAMVWVRRGFSSTGTGLSAVLAFALSLTIELARMMKPGLTPDFTAPFVAAVGAAAAFIAAPKLWKLFEEEARRSVPRNSPVLEVARAVKLLNVVELRSPYMQKPGLTPRDFDLLRSKRANRQAS